MNSVPFNFEVSNFDIFAGLGKHYEEYKVAEIYDNGNHQVPVLIKLQVKPAAAATLSIKSFDDAIDLCFHSNGASLSGTGLEVSRIKTQFCQVLNGKFAPSDIKTHNSAYDVGKDQESCWEESGIYYFQRYITVPHGVRRDSEKIACRINTTEEGKPTAVTTAIKRDETTSGQAWTNDKYITLDVINSIDYTQASNLEVMSKDHIRYFKEQYRTDLWAGIDDFYVVPHAARLRTWGQQLPSPTSVDHWIPDLPERDGTSSVASCYIVPKGYSRDKSDGKAVVRRFLEKTVDRHPATITTKDGEKLGIVGDSADMIRYNRSSNADTTLFFIDREHYGVWSGSINLWYHDHHFLLGDIRRYYQYEIPAADNAHHHWDDTLIDGAIRLSACNHRYPRSELSMYDEITTNSRITVHVKDNYGNAGTITVSTINDAGDEHPWPQLSVNGSTKL